MRTGSRLAVAVILVAVAACAGGAYAGANPNHKIALHVKSHPTSCTGNYPNFATCAQIETTYPGMGDIDVMPVFYDLVSYTVVETGLRWPDAWGTGSWVRCKGDMAVGNIVHPGDGTAVAWTTCQYTWSIAIGYAWLAAAGPGYLCPVPNPTTNDWGAVDCAPEPGPYYDYPAEASCAGVGGIYGDDPCRPDGSQESTWGAIKSAYR